MNMILNTDSYKVSMWKQYPPGTSGVFSYIESRGGRYDSTVFFGLQAFLMEYLSKPITQENIDEADEVLTAHGLPFNREGWEHILKDHGGFMPVVINAVPEGTIVPVKNVLVTVENTCGQCYWVTTWLETALLRAVWYPTTVATISRAIKEIIAEYLERTGDPAGLPFKLHDFGARGVSSFESAGLGGAAHLINFMGTDTISGIMAARKYYNEPMAGFSIPAAEHSTITSWGIDAEVDAYENMLTQFAKPGSIVAVVSDSWNIFHAAEKLWGEQLRDRVIESGATVVIRPDSGDPEEVCVKLIEILDAKFGHTVNAKGYKVLNNVRIIQGDGVNEITIRSILGHFAFRGYSADNIAFGMGGALLQQMDRDTQKFAMKCSAVYIDGIGWEDVSKNPITDPGKVSKGGLLALYKNPVTGGYYTDLEDHGNSVLNTVFVDGKITKEYTLGEIRENSNSKN